MNVLKQSDNLTPQQVYKLTMAPGSKKMKESVGQVLEVKGFCLYEDADKKSGEIRKVLSIETMDGDVLGTNSPTFIEDFMDMQEYFASCNLLVNSIKVISGTSKAGREFITCTLAD